MTRPIAGVTGAGSGIGAAIAATLGARGFHVVATDLDLSSAESTASRTNARELYEGMTTETSPCSILCNSCIKKSAGQRGGFRSRGVIPSE